MFENALLVGYSGFVGSTLAQQIDFKAQVSGRGDDLAEGEFELAVCTAAPGVKWLANKEPEADEQAITSLRAKLGRVSAEHLVLVSTVDVYSDSVGANESTVDRFSADAYGKNRRLLEEWAVRAFAKVTIIRLPGLVGTGLRKNLLFDTHEARNITVNPASTMQFYPTARLATDIATAISSQKPLMNFAVPPVRLDEILTGFETVTFAADAPKYSYDMHTEFAQDFGETGNYIMSKQASLDAIVEYLGTRA